MQPATVKSLGIPALTETCSLLQRRRLFFPPTFLQDYVLRRRYSYREYFKAVSECSQQ